MPTRAKKLKGVIFDMDGVLCLSEPFIAEAACRMFADTYGVAATHEDFAPFVGTGEDRFIGGVAEKYGVRLTMPRDKARTYAIYLEIIKGNLRPLPGVHRFIDTCRRRGLNLAVATSADRVKLDGNLVEIGLPLAEFDASVNGDEIPHKKPAPDIFLLAAKRLGLDPSECLVIEDAPSGVQAAKAGGFRCLGLTTTFSRSDLKRAGADFIAKGLARTPKAVSELWPSVRRGSRSVRRGSPDPAVQPTEGLPGGQGHLRSGKVRGRETGAQRRRETGAQRRRETGAQRSSGPLRILYVASECAPFAKTGGLGDVVAGLSKAMRRAGHDARVLMPLFGSIDRAEYGLEFVRSCCVHFGHDNEQWVGLYRGMLDGQVPVWFIDCEKYFARPNLYGSLDDPLRYGLLSKAALQVCKDEGFIPDVMHLHDWMTALSAVYLKTWDRVLSPLSVTASVLTIHNIGYQGKFGAGFLPPLGIGWEHYTPLKLEDYGMINLLKAGVYFSDAITTVSPTHANEIRQPLGGMGLAPFINDRGDDVCGILNGVDYEHWDPATDFMIPARYTAEDLTGKAECKRALQERMGLEVRPDLPLFGVVSRFASQKGFNLLIEALPAVMAEMAVQFVVLGSGEDPLEKAFAALPGQYPGRIGVHVGYDTALSHLVEAGSDFFVMPSLYEPCGLNQVYSLKYGTLPIVRATGGLDDTVENYDETTGSGTGFKFWLPTGQALHDTIGWANATWWDRPDHIRLMQRLGMAQVFSWDAAATEYLDVYQHAMAKQRGG